MKTISQHITKGPVRYKDGKVVSEGGNYIANFEVSHYLTDNETHANGLLICEAFNAAHETGKTPRELVELLREVTEAYAGSDTLGFQTVINRIQSIL